MCNTQVLCDWNSDSYFWETYLQYTYPALSKWKNLLLRFLVNGYTRFTSKWKFYFHFHILNAVPNYMVTYVYVICPLA